MPQDDFFLILRALSNAAIGRDLTYRDLFPDSTVMDIGEGVRIRVLTLEKLIAIKEERGGEKDRAVLPILRRALEEKRKQDQED